MTDTARDQAIVQCQSIVQMVAALDVDYDRLAELRELRKTLRFVAGWNMPGYMPDSEPASFDNAENARIYIADEMESEADNIESDVENPDESDLEPITAEWSSRATCAQLREAAERVRAGSGEYGLTVGAYHYWVTQDGNMLEPDENEELQELENAAGECTSEDDAQQAIDEDPLSVEYRSDWSSPGEALTPSEFRIVLCAGGPHVEIRGEINHRGDPCSPRIIYKDWGTTGELFDFDHVAVLRYCSRFVFAQ